jgi:hypothetical protein
MGEGGRDANILTPEILEDMINAVKQPDKNNYKTYASQIQAIYRMYYNESDYGGEITRGIIDTQAALLCGEGLNTVVFDSPEFLETQEEQKTKQTDQQQNQTQEQTKGQQKIQSLDNSQESQDNPNDTQTQSQNPDEEQQQSPPEPIDETKESVKEFINNFVKWNKLQGEGLIEIGQCGCMEGKALIVLNPIQLEDKKIIKIALFDYYTTGYNIERDPITSEINKIIYTQNNEAIGIPIDRAVFIQFSGTKKDYVKTPPKIANVLTQIENYSRAKYDLRKNNHLFSKTTPFFKTLDQSAANSINNDIQKKKWVVGMGYAGTSDFSYVSQTTGASECINQERIMDMKDIATTIGLPIFFMNYPELMSNRAVADTMMESVNQSTKKDRLCLQSGMIELIQKAMKLGIVEGVEGAVDEPDIFDINIPLVTLDSLKALIETWCVLMDKKIVSKQTVQGKVPGINPIDEEKLIQEETKENIANNPIVQGTMSDIMKESKQKAGEKIIEQTNKKIQTFRRQKNVRSK